MDPTSVTTVHAGPAERRSRRRAGVGRASPSVMAAALLFAAAALPGAALATSGAAAGTAPGGGSPGASTVGGSALLIALAAGAVAAVVAWAASRRRKPAAAALPADPRVEPPDHERLLADALAARTGRRPPDGAPRPAWVRRLGHESEPARHPPLAEPDLDVEGI